MKKPNRLEKETKYNTGKEELNIKELVQVKKQNQEFYRRKYSLINKAVYYEDNYER
ncbi:MAG: hypothetical protein ACOC1X_02470 [Promethearchaeota archaeon]